MSMDHWYNREYDRWRGFDEQPQETLRQKKIKEEFAVVKKEEDNKSNHEQIIDELKELDKNLRNFREGLQNVEEILKKMATFLSEVKKGKADEN